MVANSVTDWSTLALVLVFLLLDLPVLPFWPAVVAFPVMLKYYVFMSNWVILH